jgi:hypothetical protein
MASAYTQVAAALHWFTPIAFQAGHRDSRMVSSKASDTSANLAPTQPEGDPEERSRFSRPGFPTSATRDQTLLLPDRAAVAKTAVDDMCGGSFDGLHDLNQ